MVTIETTGLVGPDGKLRLEVTVPSPEQKVDVVLVISPQSPSTPAQGGPSSDLRERLAGNPAAAHIRVPAPGKRNMRRPEPIVVNDGSSASEQLVRDRR